MPLRDPKFWLRVARWVFWAGLILGVLAVLGMMYVGFAFTGGVKLPESSFDTLVIIGLPTVFAATAAISMGWWFPVLMAGSTAAGLSVAILDTDKPSRKVGYIIGAVLCIVITVLAIFMLVDMGATRTPI